MSEPVIVKIPGPHIRGDQNAELKNQFTELIANDKCSLVLDFDDVEFIDSSFMGLLIIILKKCDAQKGGVRICCLKKPLHDIFDAMRLSRLFKIYDSPEAAVEAFNS